MSDEKIFREAVKKFGFNKQCDILIEEMAELIQAIIKMRRNKNMDIGVASENFIEELVDVEIVLSEILAATLERNDRLKIYAEIRAKKLLRLEKLLEEK